jgi:hypothetical protein
MQKKSLRRFIAFLTTLVMTFGSIGLDPSSLMAMTAFGPDSFEFEALDFAPLNSDQADEVDLTANTTTLTLVEGATGIGVADAVSFTAHLTWDDSGNTEDVDDGVAVNWEIEVDGDPSIDWLEVTGGNVTGGDGEATAILSINGAAPIVATGITDTYVAVITATCDDSGEFDTVTVTVTVNQATGPNVNSGTFNIVPEEARPTGTVFTVATTPASVATHFRFVDSQVGDAEGAFLVSNAGAITVQSGAAVPDAAGIAADPDWPNVLAIEAGIEVTDGATTVIRFGDPEAITVTYNAAALPQALTISPTSITINDSNFGTTQSVTFGQGNGIPDLSLVNITSPDPLDGVNFNNNTMVFGTGTANFTGTRPLPGEGNISHTHTMTARVEAAGGSGDVWEGTFTLIVDLTELTYANPAFGAASPTTHSLYYGSSANISGFVVTGVPAPTTALTSVTPAEAGITWTASGTAGTLVVANTVPVGTYTVLLTASAIVDGNPETAEHTIVITVNPPPDFQVDTSGPVIQAERLGGSSIAPGGGAQAYVFGSVGGASGSPVPTHIQARIQNADGSFGPWITPPNTPNASNFQQGWLGAIPNGDGTWDLVQRITGPAGAQVSWAALPAFDVADPSANVREVEVRVGNNINWSDGAHVMTLTLTRLTTPTIPDQQVFAGALGGTTIGNISAEGANVWRFSNAGGTAGSANPQGVTWIQVDNSGRLFVPADQVAPAVGSHSFYLQAGVGAAWGTVSPVTINIVPAPTWVFAVPNAGVTRHVASDAIAGTPIGEALQVTVDGTDRTNGAVWQFEGTRPDWIAANPANGQLVIDGAGTIPAAGTHIVGVRPVVEGIPAADYTNITITVVDVDITLTGHDTARTLLEFSEGFQTVGGNLTATVDDDFGAEFVWEMLRQGAQGSNIGSHNFSWLDIAPGSGNTATIVVPDGRTVYPTQGTISVTGTNGPRGTARVQVRVGLLGSFTDWTWVDIVLTPGGHPVITAGQEFFAAADMTDNIIGTVATTGGPAHFFRLYDDAAGTTGNTIAWLAINSSTGMLHVPSGQNVPSNVGDEVTVYVHAARELNAGGLPQFDYEEGRWSARTPVTITIVSADQVIVPPGQTRSVEGGITGGTGGTDLVPVLNSSNVIPDTWAIAGTATGGTAPAWIDIRDNGMLFVPEDATVPAFNNSYDEGHEQNQRSVYVQASVAGEAASLSGWIRVTINLTPDQTTATTINVGNPRSFNVRGGSSIGTTIGGPNHVVVPSDVSVTNIQWELTDEHGLPFGDANFSISNAGVISVVNSPTFTNSGNDLINRYHVRVRAMVGSIQLPWSDPVRITINVTDPDAQFEIILESPITNATSVRQGVTESFVARAIDSRGQVVDGNVVWSLVSGTPIGTTNMASNGQLTVAANQTLTTRIGNTNNFENQLVFEANFPGATPVQVTVNIVPFVRVIPIVTSIDAFYDYILISFNSRLYTGANGVPASEQFIVERTEPGEGGRTTRMQLADSGAVVVEGNQVRLNLHDTNFVEIGDIIRVSYAVPAGPTAARLQGSAGPDGGVAQEPVAAIGFDRPEVNNNVRPIGVVDARMFPNSQGRLDQGNTLDGEDVTLEVEIENAIFSHNPVNIGIGGIDVTNWFTARHIDGFRANITEFTTYGTDTTVTPNRPRRIRALVRFQGTVDIDAEIIPGSISSANLQLPTGVHATAEIEVREGSMRFEVRPDASRPNARVNRISGVTGTPVVDSNYAVLMTSNGVRFNDTRQDAAWPTTTDGRPLLRVDLSAATFANRIQSTGGGTDVSNWFITTDIRNFSATITNVNGARTQATIAIGGTPSSVDATIEAFQIPAADIATAAVTTPLRMTNSININNDNDRIERAVATEVPGRIRTRANADYTGDNAFAHVEGNRGSGNIVQLGATQRFHSNPPVAVGSTTPNLAGVQAWEIMGHNTETGERDRDTAVPAWLGINSQGWFVVNSNQRVPDFSRQSSADNRITVWVRAGFNAVSTRLWGDWQQFTITITPPGPVVTTGQTIEALAGAPAGTDLGERLTVELAGESVPLMGTWEVRQRQNHPDISQTTWFDIDRTFGQIRSEVAVPAHSATASRNSSTFQVRVNDDVLWSPWVTVNMEIVPALVYVEGIVGGVEGRELSEVTAIGALPDRQTVVVGLSDAADELDTNTAFFFHHVILPPRTGNANPVEVDVTNWFNSTGITNFSARVDRQRTYNHYFDIAWRASQSVTDLNRPTPSDLDMLTGGQPNWHAFNNRGAFGDVPPTLMNEVVIAFFGVPTTYEATINLRQIPTSPLQFLMPPMTTLTTTREVPTGIMHLPDASLNRVPDDRLGRNDVMHEVVVFDEDDVAEWFSEWNNHAWSFTEVRDNNGNIVTRFNENLLEWTYNENAPATELPYYFPVSSGNQEGTLLRDRHQMTVAVPLHWEVEDPHPWRDLTEYNGQNFDQRFDDGLIVHVAVTAENEANLQYAYVFYNMNNPEGNLPVDTYAIRWNNQRHGHLNGGGGFIGDPTGSSFSELENLMVAFLATAPGDYTVTLTLYQLDPDVDIRNDNLPAANRMHRLAQARETITVAPGMAAPSIQRIVARDMDPVTGELFSEMDGIEYDVEVAFYFDGNVHPFFVPNQDDLRIYVEGSLVNWEFVEVRSSDPDHQRPATLSTFGTAGPFSTGNVGTVDFGTETATFGELIGDCGTGFGDCCAPDDGEELVFEFRRTLDPDVSVEDYDALNLEFNPVGYVCACSNPNDPGMSGCGGNGLNSGGGGRLAWNCGDVGDGEGAGCHCNLLVNMGNGLTCNCHLPPEHCPCANPNAPASSCGVFQDRNGGCLNSGGCGFSCWSASANIADVCGVRAGDGLPGNTGCGVHGTQRTETGRFGGNSCNCAPEGQDPGWDDGHREGPFCGMSLADGDTGCGMRNCDNGWGECHATAGAATPPPNINPCGRNVHGTACSCSAALCRMNCNCVMSFGGPNMARCDDGAAAQGAGNLEAECTCYVDWGSSGVEGEGSDVFVVSIERISFGQAIRVEYNGAPPDIDAATSERLTLEALEAFAALSVGGRTLEIEPDRDYLRGFSRPFAPVANFDRPAENGVHLEVTLTTQSELVHYLNLAAQHPEAPVFINLHNANTGGNNEDVFEIRNSGNTGELIISENVTLYIGDRSDAQITTNARVTEETNIVLRGDGGNEGRGGTINITNGSTLDLDGSLHVQTNGIVNMHWDAEFNVNDGGVMSLQTHTEAPPSNGGSDEAGARALFAPLNVHDDFFYDRGTERVNRSGMFNAAVHAPIGATHAASISLSEGGIIGGYHNVRGLITIQPGGILTRDEQVHISRIPSANQLITLGGIGDNATLEMHPESLIVANMSEGRIGTATAAPSATGRFIDPGFMIVRGIATAHNRPIAGDNGHHGPFIVDEHMVFFVRAGAQLHVSALTGGTGEVIRVQNNARIIVQDAASIIRADDASRITLGNAAELNNRDGLSDSLVNVPGVSGRVFNANNVELQPDRGLWRGNVHLVSLRDGFVPGETITVTPSTVSLTDTQDSATATVEGGSGTITVTGERPDWLDITVDGTTINIAARRHMLPEEHIEGHVIVTVNRGTASAALRINYDVTYDYTPTIEVGAQQGQLFGGFGAASYATFVVRVFNWEADAAITLSGADVAGLPAGLTVTGSIAEFVDNPVMEELFNGTGVLRLDAAENNEIAAGTSQANITLEEITSENFAVVVTARGPVPFPVISAQTRTIQQGTAGPENVGAPVTVQNGPVVEWEVEDLPTWLGFDDGQLYVPQGQTVPMQSEVASVPVRVRASNNAGWGEFGTVTVNVTTEPQAQIPVVTPNQNRSVDGNQQGPHNLGAALTASNNPTNWSATGLPAWLNISSAGQLYVPAGQTVPNPETATATYTIQVTASNDAGDSLAVPVDVIVEREVPAPLLPAYNSAMGVINRLRANSQLILDAIAGNLNAAAAGEFVFEEIRQAWAREIEANQVPTTFVWDQGPTFREQQGNVDGYLRGTILLGLEGYTVTIEVDITFNGEQGPPPGINFEFTPGPIMSELRISVGGRTGAHVMHVQSITTDHLTVWLSLPLPSGSGVEYVDISALTNIVTVILTQGAGSRPALIGGNEPIVDIREWDRP